MFQQQGWNFIAYSELFEHILATEVEELLDSVMADALLQFDQLLDKVLGEIDR